MVTAINLKSHMDIKMHKMNPKKAFIGIFLLSFIFLSFSTVGADELQEFLDSTQITVTVNQSQSQVDFSLDTSGRTWDTQSVNIRDVIIGDITIIFI